MTFVAKVAGGTGAGAKMRPADDTLKCPGCGGFLSRTRAANGATLCLRCAPAVALPEMRR